MNGWIKSIRKQKNFAFAELRDGTAHQSLQAVIPAVLAKSYVRSLLVFHLIDEYSYRLNLGMSVELQGDIVLTPTAPQPMELCVSTVDVLGECDPEVW